MAVYEMRLDLMNVDVSKITSKMIQRWCYPEKLNAIGKYKTRNGFYIIPSDYQSYCNLLNKIELIDDKNVVYAKPVVEKRHLCPYNSVIGSSEIGICQTDITEYPNYIKIANFPLSTTSNKIKEWLSSYDSHIEDIQLIKMRNSMTAIVKFSFIYEAFLSLFKSGLIYENRILIAKKFRFYG